MLIMEMSLMSIRTSIRTNSRRCMTKLRAGAMTMTMAIAVISSLLPLSLSLSLSAAIW
jgi:hypothetical protein